MATMWQKGFRKRKECQSTYATVLVTLPLFYFYIPAPPFKAFFLMKLEVGHTVGLFVELLGL